MQHINFALCSGDWANIFDFHDSIFFFILYMLIKFNALEIGIC